MPGRLTDVVVIGGGALGAATAWWLARAGCSVLMVEEASRGQLRRQARGVAWSAHPSWSPGERSLLGEATDAWREVEQQTGAALLTRHDALDHGLQATAVDRADAGTWLEPAQAARRWPGMRFDGPVLLRRNAALQVGADHALSALTAGAVALGAVVRYHSPVTAVEPLDDARVEVRTPDGPIRARRAVITSVSTPSSPGVELHFTPDGDQPDLPLIAHHDPDLGLVRAAPCAYGHLAVGAGSWPRGTLGDLRELVQKRWQRMDVDRPEPVGPEAMSTMPAEVSVQLRGPIVSAAATALGSVVTVAQARELARHVMTADLPDAPPAATASAHGT